MPRKVRAIRRAVTNENDENSASTRLTRAKAAALDNPADPPKKALTTKRSVSSTALNVTQAARKRSALGDVSNVNKVLDDTKSLIKQGGLSKTQKPSGISKLSRTTSRPALGTKPANTVSSDLKRPASGSGVGGNANKKRNTSLTISAKEEEEEEEEEADDVKQEVVKHEQIKHADVSAREEKWELADVKDLDSEDIDDPLMVAEYVVEIFDYMKELEITTMPNPDYMQKQTELEWKMRGILIDWLLEVHSRFRLLPETLFLTVNIIDRFLSRKVVQLDRLQLVGVTAMFIASKYEEVLSPHVQNFRHVADDGFTEAEILSAERFILAALDYDLSYPTPMNFLRRISKADNYDIQSRTLGKYLLEIGCMDHRFLKYPPSHVAATAMYLSRLALGRGQWDATIAHYAGYTEEEIEPVFKLMLEYLIAPVVHDAFFRKYASKKFMKGKLLPSVSSYMTNNTQHRYTFAHGPRHGPQYTSRTSVSPPLEEIPRKFISIASASQPFLIQFSAFIRSTKALRPTTLAHSVSASTENRDMQSLGTAAILLLPRRLHRSDGADRSVSTYQTTSHEPLASNNTNLACSNRTSSSLCILAGARFLFSPQSPETVEPRSTVQMDRCKSPYMCVLCCMYMLCNLCRCRSRLGRSPRLLLLPLLALHGLRGLQQLERARRPGLALLLVGREHVVEVLLELVVREPSPLLDPARHLRLDSLPVLVGPVRVLERAPRRQQRGPVVARPALLARGLGAGEDGAGARFGLVADGPLLVLVGLLGVVLARRRSYSARVRPYSPSSSSKSMYAFQTSSGMSRAGSSTASSKMARARSTSSRPRSSSANLIQACPLLGLYSMCLL